MMGCGKADWANELRESQQATVESVAAKAVRLADAYDHAQDPRGSAKRETRLEDAYRDWKATQPTPVDAHAQMLAARVEGLEKDINGLQHVWTRVRVLESKVETLESAKVVPADVTYNLLRRCLVALPVTSDLAKDITEFLRNR
jgi:hypothetical protein